MARREGPVLGVSFGPESALYSFPGGHPMNSGRTRLFGESLSRTVEDRRGELSHLITVVRPEEARRDDLRLFHTNQYIESVEEASKRGEGYLDFPDTPAFAGVFEASLYPVGSSLHGFEAVLEGRFRHFFNPVGGLHHAARNRSSGFCVFNDAAIVIAKALDRTGMKRVLYVDIDAHHGDGVFYGYESDPRVIIADIHEDGRSLFPGTGEPSETGKDGAEGTKLNLPLLPGSGDAEFIETFDAAFRFMERFEPEFVFFQCGADGLSGDPLTHLRYSASAHAYAAKKLHELAHDTCSGRLLAMGGGGYKAENVDAAWSAVAKELASCG